MDVLVLGGTRFVGRCAVEQAVAAGHRVTAFNRGVTGAVPSGAAHVRGDRTVAGDLEPLTGPYDLVIDTWTGPPAVVAASADGLRERAAFYAYVSSVNAYPGWPEAEDYHDGGTWDGDPDATAPPDDLGPSEAYGWSKVGAERAVARAFGDARSAVLRAASIAGPHDNVGRLPWWLARVARGGRVLVPGAPEDPIAQVDARDLAQLALDRVPGTHEVAGPAVPRSRLMAACLTATGSSASLTWVASDWLAEQDVEPWTEVPLWVPGAPSVFRHRPSPALRCRPLEETVADAWRWMPAGWQPSALAPGMDPDKEALLLKRWDERS